MNIAAARRIKLIRPPSFAPWQIFSYLGQFFQYTDLLLTLSLHRIKIRYKQSALGLAWALLQPLSLMAIYTVIFSVVTRMPSEGVPYAVFVYSALLPWTFFSSSVSTASSALVSHNQLITKVYFPREILPVTYVTAAGFDFSIASLVLASMMGFYRIVPGSEILWLIPIMAVAVSFTLALALLLSAVQVWFRDVGLAMPLVMQLWMFASPVVYPLSAVPQRFRGYYMLNPMTGVVENFRRVALQGIGPDVDSLTRSAIIGAIFLPLSYLYFKKREATMADVI